MLFRCSPSVSGLIGESSSCAAATTPAPAWSAPCTASARGMGAVTAA